MPNQPDPPWRVLAIAHCDPQEPHWWLFINTDVEWEAEAGLFTEESHRLDPIYHPRNDPEALEIIRKAKEEQ